MSKEEEIFAAVLRRVTERDDRNVLRCRDAFEAAEEIGVAVGEVGRVCNLQGIKIAACQLGCFK